MEKVEIYKLNFKFKKENDLPLNQHAQIRLNSHLLKTKKQLIVPHISWKK